MTKRALACAALLVLLSPSAHAEEPKVHTYVDENGRTHVVAIPKTPAKTKSTSAKSGQSTGKGARRSRVTEDDGCGNAGSYVSEWRQIGREIRRVQEAIDEVSERDEQRLHNGCNRAAQQANGCRPESYDRDELLAAGETKLAKLEEQRSAIEDKARQKEIPAHCFRD